MSRKDELIYEMEKLVKGVSILKKSESKLMRGIGKVLFFNKNFMDGYITTIGKTIYFPDDMNPDAPTSLPILAHEMVHVYDYNKHPVWFTVSYLMPQALVVLSLCSIAAIWSSNWWLLCLLFLGFLAPIPSPWRTKAERRGYLMSLATRVWTKKTTPDMVKEVLHQFTSSAYYFMCRDEAALAKWFEEELRKIRSGKMPDPVFELVYDFYTQRRIRA